MSDLNERAQAILAEEPNIGRAKLARKLGVKQWVARDILAGKAATGAPLKPIKSAEKSEYGSDTAVLTRTTSKRVKTLEQLLAICEVDASEWTVDRWICEKYDCVAIPRAEGSDKQGWKRKDSRPTITEMYLVKAWLKRRHEVVAAKNEIEALRQKAEQHAPQYPAIICRDIKKSGNLVEYSIYDHHFGAHIWGRETGGADYDLRIAKNCYEQALSSLVGRTREHKPDRALLILGNDQQNADNRAGTTERGTPQSMDTRYQKVFSVSRDVSIWAVEALLSFVPSVEVIIVPGNHDPLSAWHLGDSLAAWFRNCAAVKVNNEPTQRKYIEHGVNMLMYSHGNGGKLEDYGRTMAAEQPAMWGRTWWREAHTGDKHHRRLIEFPGVTVRILPSLRPPCAWSADNHYIGAVRAAEAYAFNEREGLIGTGVYSILDERSAVTECGPTSKTNGQSTNC